jgi:hypothetical protein
MGTRRREVVDGPDALEQLYGVEPEQFIAERKRLERSLRDSGRTEEADELAQRKKPPLPVFVANRLARVSPDDIAGLISAGERLTAAHAAGDPAELRKEQAELARRIRTLVQKAEAAAGQLLSGAMEQRLAVLLRAAASDPASAGLLRRGVLAEEVEPAAFGALAGISLASPKRRQEPDRGADRAFEEKRRARVEDLKSELADARDALRRAKRELGKAEAEVKRAERRVAQLADRLDDARSSAS